MDHDEIHQTAVPADPSAALYRWRFADVEFDEARFELRVGGVVVDVQPKPLALLGELLRNAGRTLARDALYDAVWGDRVTVDNVLANAISKLRSVLGEQGSKRLVTVPRLGYRLDGPLERLALSVPVPAPALVAGASVPGRPGDILARPLGHSFGHTTWLVNPAHGGSPLVFKFASSPPALAALKREVTVARLLDEALGRRDDFVQVLSWNFEHAPFWLCTAFAGQSLLEWAGSGEPSPLAALDADARLALAARMADAVAAAHGVGVLHRDLKPANVLIGDGDGANTVRLADFGSAQLLEPERLEQLRITRLGMTLQGTPDATSGTPLYMAPELAQGAAPSTAGDVYALGVMLYQLMVGDFRRLLAPGWEREVADPLVRDDIARATDGDPQHRLASAAELARRLRTLADRRRAAQAADEESRQAAADRAALLRNRARRPWAAAAFTLAVIGLGGTLAWALAERRERTAMQASLEHGQSLLRLYQEGVIDPSAAGAAPTAGLTVAQAVAQAAESIEERFGSDTPLQRALKHESVQRVLSAAGEPVRAIAAGRRGLALDAGPEVALRIRVQLVEDQLASGRLDDATATLAALRESGERPSGSLVSSRAATIEARLASIRGERGAAARLGEALAKLRTAEPNGSETYEAGTIELARRMANHGDAASAEARLRELLDNQTRVLGPGHARTARTQLALGQVLLQQRRAGEAAQQIFEGTSNLFAVLGRRHPLTHRALDDLAGAMFQAQDFKRAAFHWDTLRGWLVEDAGASSSLTLLAQAQVGLARLRAGSAIEAEPLLREALDRVGVVLDAGAPQHQYQRLLLAECELALGRIDAARTLLERIEPAALAAHSGDPDPGARLTVLRQRAGL